MSLKSRNQFSNVRCVWDLYSYQLLILQTKIDAIIFILINDVLKKVQNVAKSKLFTVAFLRNKILIRNFHYPNDGSWSNFNFPLFFP